jgi:hypothetical protein
MATEVTWRSFSHFAIRSNSGVVAPKISHLANAPLKRRSARPVPFAAQINTGHVTLNHGQSLNFSRLFGVARFLSALLHRSTFLNTSAQVGRYVDSAL